MGQYGLLHPSGNSNLRAPLRGTFFHRLFLCVSWTDLFSLLSSFRDDQAVYDRFSHIQNFQPKFYIGSTLSFALGSGTFLLQKTPASATEHIRFGQSRLALLEPIWQFLDVHPPAVQWQIQLLGFGASLNPIVATPSQYILRSCTNFSTAGKASSKEFRFRLHDNFAPSHCGGN